jgi:MSHA biogenesis protein MshN
MSIINTMLRDLDKRNARSGAGATAGDGVRAAQPTRRLRAGRHSKPALAGVALVAAAAAWWIPQRFAAATLPVAVQAARPSFVATAGPAAVQPAAPGPSAAPAATVHDLTAAAHSPNAAAIASVGAASASTGAPAARAATAAPRAIALANAPGNATANAHANAHANAAANAPANTAANARANAPAIARANATASTTANASGNAPANAPAIAARAEPKSSVSTAMLSSPPSGAVAGTLDVTATPGRADEGPSPTPPAATAKTYGPAQMSAKLVGEAQVAAGQGRQDEARTLLQKALAASPQDVTAREMLVGLHVDAGRLDEARTLLEEGQRLQPERASFALSLARMRAEAGDARGAIRLLDGVRATAGDDPQYHAVLAALLLDDKRYEEAAQHYLVALRADPANTRWLVGIGVAWENTGKPAQALEAYRRADAAPALQPEVASFIAERLARLGVHARAADPQPLDGIRESRR